MTRGVVLIVDSERECVARLVELLSPLPLTVVAAFDQTQAVEFTLSRSIDLCLISHGLADGNGIRLFSRLRQTRRGLRGVLLARHVDLRVVFEAIGSGFAHVLLKPVDGRQLYTILSEVFGRLPAESLPVELLNIKECPMTDSHPDLEAIAAISTHDIRERLSVSELITVIRSVDYPFAGKERLEYFDRDTLERVVCLVRRWSQQRLDLLRGQSEHSTSMRATA